MQRAEPGTDQRRNCGRRHRAQIKDAFATASADSLPGRMGIKILEASAQRVVGTMPVAGNTQPYGLLHGGASCVLAETLGSLGSALHAGLDRVTVGIEINATHHRGAAQAKSPAWPRSCTAAAR